MNLCVVSTFDCTVADYRSMVADFEEDVRSCVAEWEIAEINEHKVAIMLNVTDMDAFMAVMSSPKMTAWDAANTCVDIVYSLEKMN